MTELHEIYEISTKELVIELRHKSEKSWNSYSILTNKETKYAKSLYELHNLYEKLISVVLEQTQGPTQIS